MTKQPSALGYALPLIFAIALVGGFAAYKVSGAKPSIEVTAVDQPVAAADQPAGEVRWLKGQTHAHTSNGPDSKEPVDSVLAFYADAGFDFVVLTDHNHVTTAKGPEGLLAIPGAEITQTREKCDPMPEGAEKCAMHMNALFVDPSRAKEAFLEPPTSRTLDVYRAEMEAAKQLGGLAQLNHPNYHYTAADAELLVALSKEGLRFVEVMNEAAALNSGGDEKHPPVEAIWDQALSRGAKLYAIASDDAHDYSDADAKRARGEKPAVVNQGFIYVKARKDAQSIREAMERGDFYASNGVRISGLGVMTHGARDGGETSHVLFVAVDEAHEDPLIKFIGEGGKVLREERASEARFTLDPSAGRYVRVVVEAGGKRALTQPWFRPE